MIKNIVLKLFFQNIIIYLELLIYLDCKGLFKRDDFINGIFTYTWDKHRWERLRKEIPAVESNIIDNAMVDYHAFLNQPYITDTTGIHPAVEDVVNNPSHYNKGGIECIDAIAAATGEGFEFYLQGNIMKYMWRYRYKNGTEDLKKARWYLDKLIKEVEGCYDDKS